MTDERIHLPGPFILARASTLGLLLLSSSDCIQIWSPFIEYDVVDAGTPVIDASVPAVDEAVPVLPVLSAVTPAIGPTAGGIMLTLSGQNFFPGATVTIAGVTAVTTGSGSTLSVTLPAQAGAFGQVPVVVRNPDGQSVSRSDLFAYFASQTDFNPVATIPAGTGPQMVAAGDFNADQKLDLAVSNGSGNAVTILLGDGKGGFAAAPKSPITSNTGPVGIVSRDFNGDQKLDLAVANQTTNAVAVLLGDGAGGFSPATKSPYITSSQPIWLVTGDFNSDQKSDLAVTAFSGNVVNVLLGDGTGVFSLSPKTPAATGAGPFPMAAGDFNADQKLDVAVGNFSANNVSVLLGDGAGGFSPATPPTVAVGTNPLAVATGDFNSDQKLDLAVVNTTNSLSLLLGDGKGGFSPLAPITFAAGTAPRAVAVTDFNGDQRLDLVIANAGPGNAAVLLGDGAGAFSAVAKSPYKAGTAPTAVTVADFNNDQKPDFVIANLTSNNITVVLNQSQ